MPGKTQPGVLRERPILTAQLFLQSQIRIQTNKPNLNRDRWAGASHSRLPTISLALQEFHTRQMPDLGSHPQGNYAEKFRSIDVGNDL